MTQRDASALPRPPGRLARGAGQLALAASMALGLAACNDGYGSSDGSLSCSTPDQETWLAGFFADNYLWSAYSPPFPPQTAQLADYFDSLLYTGGDPAFPPGVADVWSTYTSDSLFTLYWQNGQDVGWGVFVDGLEAQDSGGPLLVRYVDPGSPGALAGIVRGDQVTTVNGVPASTLIASGDFSAFSATAEGQALVLGIHDAGGDRNVSLTSAAFALTPVQGARVTTTPGGRRMGYVMVTDMIDQALMPYDAAFAQFKSAGVQDLAIDLRYMGSGFVGDGEVMASYPAVQATAGRVYVNLFFNAFLAPYQDSFYTFDAFSNALSLPRVFVLTGPRTCAAAEQFVNGLSPFVQVVTVGDATCGKPVGSTPASNCGITWSPITFQVTNANNEGAYYGGLPATCPVAENFSLPIGADADPLLAGAQHNAVGGGCPPATLAATQSARRHATIQSLRAALIEPTRRRGAVDR
jgi:carboxyl-terminal processing protease